MPTSRDFQHASVISITEVPHNRMFQSAVTVSITELPVPRCHLICTIYSVSPAIPNRYGSSKIGYSAKGGMSLLIDMDANSRQ